MSPYLPLLNTPAFAGHTTVRETLASHGSHQTNPPFNVNGGSLISLNVILSPVVSNL
jgi:hypothetical protein